MSCCSGGSFRVVMSSSLDVVIDIGSSGLVWGWWLCVCILRVRLSIVVFSVSMRVDCVIGVVII